MFTISATQKTALLLFTTIICSYWQSASRCWQIARASVNINTDRVLTLSMTSESKRELWEVPPSAHDQWRRVKLAALRPCAYLVDFGTSGNVVWLSVLSSTTVLTACGSAEMPWARVLRARILLPPAAATVAKGMTLWNLSSCDLSSTISSSRTLRTASNWRIRSFFLLTSSCNSTSEPMMNVQCLTVPQNWSIPRHTHLTHRSQTPTKSTRGLTFIPTLFTLAAFGRITPLPSNFFPSVYPSIH